ncbi:hypothetical protein [uncultured Corynebacterium sp.]|uniref:hypothetical protein n=1 Tax=uncultured Corynebacterium sp. TaxID=159447 RepID=UPI0025E9C509|nr:hypothetical protein [uncultured Corynebacterium sp.]
MSISMHIDEYMARHGITPDDTVVVDDPCAVFDGSVEKADGLEAEISRRAGMAGGDSDDVADDGLGRIADAADRDRRGAAEERLSQAVDVVRGVLD